MEDRVKLLEEIRKKGEGDITLKYLLNPEMGGHNRAALFKFLENTGLNNRI